jgi:hypothetical protein
MTDKRTHCTVTMTEELYRAVKAAAKAADQPLTVWCREAVKDKLKQTAAGA